MSLRTMRSMDIDREGLLDSPGKRATVFTEFIIQVPNAREVYVCGDWSAWDPLMMKKTKGSWWELVTSVSEGYHEYCFFVDGKHFVSPDHPRSEDMTCNWRTVSRPTEDVGKRTFAQSLRLAFPDLPVDKVRSQLRRYSSEVLRQVLYGEDVDDLEASKYKLDGKSSLWVTLRPAIIFNAAMVSYFAVYFFARGTILQGTF